jgi:hypothetical protein
MCMHQRTLPRWQIIHAPVEGERSRIVRETARIIQQRCYCSVRNAAFLTTGPRSGQLPGSFRRRRFASGRARGAGLWGPNASKVGAERDPPGAPDHARRGRAVEGPVGPREALTG